jgi:hypothetical protein
MSLLIYFLLTIIFAYNTYKYFKLDFILGLILSVYTYYLFLFLLNNFVLYFIEQESNMILLFADVNAKNLASTYIFFFSFVFLGLFRLLYRYIFKNERISIEEDEISNRLLYRSNPIQTLSILLLYFISLIYVLRSFKVDYLSYVEEIAAWDKVFFFSSSVVPIYFIYTGRIYLGLITSFTFILVSFNTTVRSFLILGNAPILFYLFYIYGKNKQKLFYIILVPLVFIIYIVFFLRNEIGLLDFILPTYAEIIFGDHDPTIVLNQNFPSLKSFFEQLFRPILLSFNYDFGPRVYDTPHYFGELIMGYIGINHFPSTLFAEAWVLYSWHGCYIFPFLFLFFIFLLRFLIYKHNLFVLFFPYLMWFMYNFIRGTMTISVVPFSYAFYISLIFLIFPIIFSSHKIVKKRF